MKLTLTMPKDASLRDVLPGLSVDTVSFVRSVMRNMDHWGCSMRLDVASDPKRPSYAVGEIMETDEDGVISGWALYGWYDGKHQWNEFEPERSWASETHMSKHDVQCLLADLLGKPRPPARDT